MNAGITIAVALVTGFVGGLSSRFVGLMPVHAQAPALPHELRAHKFILVDETGVARGVLGIETNGAPDIEATDSRGRIGASAFRQWADIHGFMNETMSPDRKGRPCCRTGRESFSPASQHALNVR